MAGRTRTSDLDFVIKTDGHCFFCLKKRSDQDTVAELEGNSSPSTSFHSLRYLSRYLRMDVGVALHQKPPQHLLHKLERSGLKVALCEGCASLNGTFSELYRQLDMIRMEMISCLNIIHQRLTCESAGVFQGGKSELDILEAVRKEALKKCSHKLSQLPPRVKVRKSTVEELKLKKLKLAELLKSPSSKAQEESVADSEGCHSDSDLDDMDYVPLNQRSDDEEQGDEMKVVEQQQPNSDGKLNPKSLSCLSCGKKFSRRQHLTRHNLTTHLKPKSFQCDECGKHFSGLDSLRDHLRCVHSIIRPYLRGKLSARKSVQLGPKAEVKNLEKELETENSKHAEVKSSSSLAQDSVGIGEGGGEVVKIEKGSHSDSDQDDINYVPLNDCSDDEPVQQEEVEVKVEDQPQPNSDRKSRRQRSLCKLCGKTFALAHHLRRHHRVIHLKIKDPQSDTRGPLPKRFACKLCDRKFARKPKLMLHQSVHLKEKPYQCDECGRQFSRQDYLRSHKKTVHVRTKSWICDHDQCGKAFSVRKRLTVHIESVHLNVKRYSCAECGRRFNRPDNLRDHRRRIHLIAKSDQFDDGDGNSVPANDCSDDLPQPEPDQEVQFELVDLPSSDGKSHSHRKRFLCKLCNKSLSTRQKLKFHHQSVHLKLKPCLCDECGMRFSRPDQLRDHQRRTHLKIRPHQCDQCESKFNTRPDLRLHVDIVHNKVKSWTCDHCGLQFGRRSNLGKHIQTVHFKLKSHQCSQCGKAYVSAADLKRHIDSIHLDVKFTCEECGEQYKSDCGLQRHRRRVHLNQIPERQHHPCSQCGKTLSTARDLRRHMDSVHLNKRKWCEECGKDFSLQTDLRRHRERHHPDPMHATSATVTNDPDPDGSPC